MFQISKMFAVLKVSHNGVSGQCIKFNNIKYKSFKEPVLENEYILSASFMTGGVNISDDYKFIQTPYPTVLMLRDDRGQPILTKNIDCIFNDYVNLDHNINLELWSDEKLIKSFDLGKASELKTEDELFDFNGVYDHLVSCFVIKGHKFLPNEFGLIGIEIVVKKGNLLKLGSIFVDPTKADLFKRVIESKPTFC